MLLTQQMCLLSASVLAPLAPVGIKLAEAVLPGGDYVVILRSRTLNIDFMET